MIIASSTLGKVKRRSELENLTFRQRDRQAALFSAVIFLKLLQLYSKVMLSALRELQAISLAGIERNFEEKINSVAV